jgi:nitrogen PTS system EIIA component
MASFSEIGGPMQVPDVNLRAVRMAELFPPELILFGLVGRSPRPVVEAMIGRFSAAGRIPVEHEAALVKLVLKREKIGSTGIGQGVALPHCRTDLVKSHLGALAIDNQGMDFAALDAKPVHLVFLVVAPQNEGELHLQVMSSVRALARDKYLCRKLRACCKPDQVMCVLGEFDATLM